MWWLGEKDGTVNLKLRCVEKSDEKLFDVYVAVGLSAFQNLFWGFSYWKKVL